MPYVWPLIHDILANPVLKVERESRSIHPSSMGILLDRDGRVQRFGGCDRAEYYRLRRYPTQRVPMDFDGRFATSVGKLTEDIMKDVFQRGWVYVGDEVPVTIERKSAKGTRYRISGRIDLIIKDPKTGYPIFLELKTPGDYKAPGNCERKNGPKALKSVQLKDTPYLPDLGYVVQVMPYLWWAREELGLVDPEFNILIYTRGYRKKGEHIVRFHRDDSIVIENADGVTHMPDLTMARVFEDTDRLADAVRAGEEPMRPFERQYSHGTIMRMFEAKAMTKGDYEAVAKQLEKDPNAEVVLLDANKNPKGDWNCNPKWCPYYHGCYGNEPTFQPGGGKLNPTIQAATTPTEIQVHNPENPV